MSIYLHNKLYFFNYHLYVHENCESSKNQSSTISLIVLNVFVSTREHLVKNIKYCS